MAIIGFIGLGQMGTPMAANLIKGGHDVYVYDINKAAINELAKQGAHATNSPSQAAKNAEFIITMLPNGKLVRHVLCNPQDGALLTFNKSGLIIDMSTIHPFESDEINKDLGSQGFSMMEAPVGRTSNHAIAGTLLILAGGSHAQIKKAQPLFDLMGSNTIDAGGVGKGIRLKIINNFMSIALNALSAEAVVLAEAMRLDFDTIMSVMSGTPAGKGHFTTTWPNKVLAGNLQPDFMIDLAHKDIEIALNVADRIHVPLPVGKAAKELYSSAQAAGRGKQDWSALLEQQRAISGLALKIKES